MAQKSFLLVKIEKFVESILGNNINLSISKHYIYTINSGSYILNLMQLIWRRSGEVEEEAIAHEGNKASRAIYLKNGLVFTTGFTKHSERQYSLRAPGHLDDPIVMVELDTSNGVMFPLYDPDANLVYLCGKVKSIK